jgi:hypothetical protein
MSRTAITTARIAVWAEMLGLPAADILDAGRWLLRYECEYCRATTHVIRMLNRLGKERAEELIARILEAKSRDDKDALEAIRSELWPK